MERYDRNPNNIEIPQRSEISSLSFNFGEIHIGESCKIKDIHHNHGVLHIEDFCNIKTLSFNNRKVSIGKHCKINDIVCNTVSSDLTIGHFSEIGDISANFNFIEIGNHSEIDKIKYNNQSGAVKVGAFANIQEITSNSCDVYIGKNSQINSITYNFGTITFGENCNIQRIEGNYGRIIAGLGSTLPPGDFSNNPSPQIEPPTPETSMVLMNSVPTDFEPEVPALAPVQVHSLARLLNAIPQFTFPSPQQQLLMLKNVWTSLILKFRIKLGIGRPPRQWLTLSEFQNQETRARTIILNRHFIRDTTPYPRRQPYSNLLRLSNPNYSWNLDPTGLNPFDGSSDDDDNIAFNESHSDSEADEVSSEDDPSHDPLEVNTTVMASTGNFSGIFAKAKKGVSAIMRKLKSFVATKLPGSASAAAEGLCSVCTENPKNIAFLCGHTCCERCSERLKTCHMCRKKITKKVKLFL